MAKKEKKKSAKKQGPEKGVAYFSARNLERAVKKGTKNEAAHAKEVMGYTTKELEGWVVREYTNGKIERVSKIEKVKRPSRLVLD